MPVQPIRLIAYIRVSVVGEREKEGESFRSPELQRKAIDGIVATMPGAKIVRELRDLNRSGGTLNRPGLNEAMAMLRAGAADGIAVARLDRFARTSKGIDAIEQLDQGGHIFVSAADRFDTSTAMGRFALGMMLLVAKLERERHVEATEILNSGKIAEGVHVVVPYGYRRSDGKGSPLEEDPKTGPIVRRIFAEAIAGRAPSEIARGLNDDGIPAKRGGIWNKQAVAALLKAPSYTGTAQWGEYSYENAHPALVSADDFERAQRPVGDVASERRTRGNGAYLLSGLVRCAACGYLMASSSHSGGRRFRCTRDHGTGVCPAPTAVFMAPLEEIVSEAFLERHGSAGARGATADVDTSAAEADVMARRQEFERWRDDVGMRDALGDDDYRSGLLARKAALTASEDTLRTIIGRAEASSLSVDRDMWESASEEERRALLKASVREVLVTRAASTRSPLAPRIAVRFIADSHDDSADVGALVA